MNRHVLMKASILMHFTGMPIFIPSLVRMIHCRICDVSGADATSVAWMGRGQGAAVQKKNKNVRSCICISILRVQCEAPKIAKLVYNSSNYGLSYL